MAKSSAAINAVRIAAIAILQSNSFFKKVFMLIPCFLSCAARSLTRLFLFR